MAQGTLGAQVAHVAHIVKSREPTPHSRQTDARHDRPLPAAGAAQLTSLRKANTHARNPPYITSHPKALTHLSVLLDCICCTLLELLQLRLARLVCHLALPTGADHGSLGGSCTLAGHLPSLARHLCVGGGCGGVKDAGYLVSGPPGEVGWPLATAMQLHKRPDRQHCKM